MMKNGRLIPVFRRSLIVLLLKAAPALAVVPVLMAPFPKLPWFVSTLAGRAGDVDGTGESASFFQASDFVLDSAGNLYVADTYNHKIRKVTPAGVVTTLAGSGTAGSVDGVGTAASFNLPRGIAMDSSGQMYVADSSGYKIRKITSDGVVTTLAGSGSSGRADGVGAAASFYVPTGIAVDTSGNLYVADSFNQLIRKITPSGVVTTFAGTGSMGHADGTGTAASFTRPNAIAIDGSGNLYVASDHKIRKITSTGIVTTLAGSGSGGDADGTGVAASFSSPRGVIVDSTGNIYIGDSGNHKIRKITSAGVVTTFAGSGVRGRVDGAGAVASFHSPYGVAIDPSGTVYVADYGNSKIRKITPSKVVTTLAGGQDVDGTGVAASFSSPQGVAVDGSGHIYVADTGNDKIRKITPMGVVTTLAGSGGFGNDDGTGATATFSAPRGVAVDGAGNVYVTDSSNHKIRKITSAGVVTTFAGSGLPGANNGTGAAATFNYPQGVAVDGAGNVYVADSSNNKIRKITSAGVVTTFAGSGSVGSVDGTGAAATFNYPGGVAVDGAGNVYVADSSNHKIRKITSAGVVTTFAGSGSMGSTDGAAATASFYAPRSVAVDGAGNVYVADWSSYKIRKITPGGMVTTLAGSGNSRSVDGAGAAASFIQPMSLCVDGSGNIYVADSHKIRKITP